MQKLAGIITEGLYTTQMDQEAPVQSEVTSNKMKKSKLKAEIKKMIQGEGYTGTPYGSSGEMALGMVKTGAGMPGSLGEANAPIHTVTTMDGKTIVGTHQYGVGFKSNENGKKMGFKDNPTSIPNGTKMQKNDSGMLEGDNLEEYDSQGLTNAASVIDHYLNMAYDAGERGVAFDDSLAYKALEHLKEFSDEFTDSTLYEAKKKEEEDTEEEVDVEAPVAPEGEVDVTMDAPAEEDTTVDINGDGTGDIDAGSSEAKKAFGDLTDAFQAAKTLGDEKLIRQIANTITYFNKNIILKQG